MPLLAIAFLCGIELLQLLPVLPRAHWAYVIGAIAVLLIWANWRYSKLLAAMLLGFAWCLWYAGAELSLRLPDQLEGKGLVVSGKVLSIPDVQKQQTTFLLALRTIAGRPAQGTVHVSWRDNPTVLKAGEVWQFTLRMKKIHSPLNPNGFDYEAWAFQEGIIANGYVVAKLPYHLLQSNRWHPIDRFRQSLYDRITAHLSASQTSCWVIALALGERHAIAPAKWQVLRHTGTNHLMAIAGLHIGFISTFIYALVVWVWRRLPLVCLMAPAQQAGAIAALGVAVFYSTLAGFSLPTQRACIMLSLFLIILLLRRHVLAWHVWGLALMGVLVINPLVPLTESFWLSFASVALIIYGMGGRLAVKGGARHHARLQWVLGLGLVPLSIYFFAQCSLVSVIANAIAVPWVGFCVLPLVLGGCCFLFISTSMGTVLLLLADKLLQLLWVFLAYLAHLSWGLWYHAVPTQGTVVLACLGVIFLLLPMGFPGRWFGAIGLLPLLLYSPSALKFAELRFTLLDVGQGLASVVQTQHHTLVFDTGARANANYDMGESVVVPFLRGAAVKKIDLLVISHGDNDHIGGAMALLQQIPVVKIKTSVPQQFTRSTAEYCLRGEHWQWDGVEFAFLYPSVHQLGLGNDSSCVLRISTGTQHILLTGDIEKIAEQYLIHHDTDLRANILVAPHHGSKTSALPEFIDRVAPSSVLFPIGYRNRYHFPHPSVVVKYQSRGIQLFNSVQGGAIQFKLTGKNEIPPPRLYRQEHLTFWRN